MESKFKGKVAFVTGAGSGIGEATAVRLAKDGALVALAGHGEDDLKAAKEKIHKNGGRAEFFVCDVKNPESMKKSIDATVNEFGRLDFIVANAGINGVWAPIEDLKPEEWNDTIQTDLTGTYLTLHYGVPHLKKNGQGAIVIIASVNGTRMFSNTGATAYACAKAAQVAMTKMLALELARSRIRVNAICPGAIETEIDDNTDLKNKNIKIPVIFPEGKIPLTDDRPGEADDVAALVAFLLSEEARHITGTPVWIDGAQSLLMG
jgi:NAD(P)-dependent dehydrogenase (short-subunit alcohol dehydrogenase family)